MSNEKQKLYRSFLFPFIFILFLWIIKWSEWYFDFSLVELGVYPKKFSGLVGLFFYPLIHADFQHILSNTVPLFILLSGVFFFYKEVAFNVFFISYFLSGILIWLGGRPSYHIGASGLIYAFGAFLFFSGVFRKHTGLMAVSLLVIFMYGSMVWSMFPFPFKDPISWEGHLFGFLIGFVLALNYRQIGEQRIRFDWENEPDDGTHSYRAHIEALKTEELSLEKDLTVFENQKLNSNATIYSWGTTKPWNDYSSFSKKYFSNRVQKISIDAGFTCPNRVGTKGVGGCTYCNNKTFNPFYCSPQKSVTQQLNEGIAFFSAKYKTQKYLAYFQAYSNTYAPFEILRDLFEEALLYPDVIGLVIATRPDCVNEKIINYLSSLSQKYYIVVEFGVETCSNKTLELINRGHTWEESLQAIEQTTSSGILTGIHLIIGLPTETKTDIINMAQQISCLPLHTLKLHQLQIIKNTRMAEMFSQHPDWVINFTAEEYIDLVIDFAEQISPKIIIERFISEAPPDMIISPKWNGLKNYEFVSKLEQRMNDRKTCQGKNFAVSVA